MFGLQDVNIFKPFIVDQIFKYHVNQRRLLNHDQT